MSDTQPGRWLRPTLAAAALVAIAGAALATPAAQVSNLPRDPGNGGRLFISKGCIACHSVYGEGGTSGPDLGRAMIGRNLPEIAAAMWNHTPTMGRQLGLLDLERPEFDRGEMSRLTAFLYFLNFVAPGSGDADRGKALFRSESCDRCHVIAGEGGDVGPPLDQLDGYLSPVVVTQRMWNHGLGMVVMARDLGLRFPTLEPQGLQDLVAYLRAASVTDGQAVLFQRPGDARRGAALFEDKGCASCHSVGGPPKPGGAPDLSRARLGVGVLSLAATLWNHMPDMYGQMERSGVLPARFTEEEMANLLAYLYSLDYSGGQPDIERGARLLTSKGCMDCHALGETSGSTPSLGESRATRSLEEGVRLLWNHAPAMLEKMDEAGLAWPRLEGDEIRDIMGYLRALTN